MKAEIEVRFLGVDYDNLRGRLSAADAHRRHPMRPMKRVIIDYPDQHLQHGVENAWAFVRLRDEGGKITLTYKEFAKNKTLDAHEIEIDVSSYEKTIELLEKVGLQVISEQHTRRELWEMGDCQVSLDDWPWLPPMVELEGPSDQALQHAADVLGLSWHDHILGNSVTAYRKIYPGMTDDESIRDIAKLTFDEMPQWLKVRQYV